MEARIFRSIGAALVGGASFEAAKATGKKVYYQIEGKTAQSVIDKLTEYSDRYGIDVIIDINLLN